MLGMRACISGDQDERVNIYSYGLYPLLVGVVHPLRPAHPAKLVGHFLDLGTRRMNPSLPLSLIVGLLIIAAQAVVGQVSITSATSLSGAAGTSISYQITANNAPTSYSASGLPSTMSVDSTTGIISGSLPTILSATAVTITATGLAGTATGTLNLVSTDSIAVTTTPEGTTPSLLGYNLGHFMTSGDAADWFRYGGMRGARVFISASELQGSTSPGRSKVSNLTTFNSIVTATRSAGTNSSTYIKWSDYNYNYDSTAGSNDINYANAFSALTGMGVDILVNITCSPGTFPLTSATDYAGWWEIWQHYYAQAYLLSRDYGIRRFSMFNEPNNWSGLTESDWLLRLRICSDAIQAGVADMNAAYERSIVPQIYAPNTANGQTKYNSGSDTWGHDAVANRHLKLDGTTSSNWFLMNVYNYQKYSMYTDDTGSSSGYSQDIDALAGYITADMPGETPFPLVLSEFNVRTSGSYDTKTENLDTASDYVALGANCIALTRHLADQLFLFKFGQTEDTTSPYGLAKNGTHYVDNINTNSSRNYGGATKAAEVYRLFNQAAQGGRSRFLANASSGADMSTNSGGSGLWRLVTQDPTTGNYYVYLVNKSSSGINLSLNVAAWSLADGTPVVVEEVSSTCSGGVSQVANVKSGQFYLGSIPAQSVWLVTIPNQAAALTATTATEDTQVGDGTISGNIGGALTSMQARADGTIDGRKAILIKIPTPSAASSNLKSILLDLGAAAGAGSNSIQAHVYGLTADSWTEGSSTWSSLTNVLKQGTSAGNQIAQNVALNTGTNPAAKMLGQILVNSTTPSRRMLDVTDFVKSRTNGYASFLVVQEHRWNYSADLTNVRTTGDTQSAGVIITSKEKTGAGPRLLAVQTGSASAAPVIFNQPQDQSFIQGCTISLSVSVDGSTAVTYQWKKDGGVIDGATGPSLVISAARLTDAGNYSCEVTNSYGTSTSAVATVTVIVPGVLIGWDFPTNSTTTDVSSGTNVAGVVGPKTFAMASGLTASARSDAWGANSWTANGTGPAPNGTTNNDYFSFEIQAGTGKKVTISGVSRLIMQVSPSGPKKWSILYAETNANSAFDPAPLRSYGPFDMTNPSPSVTNIDITTALSNAISSNPITLTEGRTGYFRLVGFAGTNSSGTGRIVATNVPGTWDFALVGAVEKTNEIIIDQTITFPSFGRQILGDDPLPLGASASSGLAVSYVSSDPTVAGISNNCAILKKVGVASITASQAGNADYYAAPDVSQTLTVSQPVPSDYLTNRYAVSTNGGISYRATNDYKGALTNLAFDLYRRTNAIVTPQPVVIMIHGGGYNASSAGRDQSYIVSLGNQLAARGFQALSIDYRLRATADRTNDDLQLPALRDAAADALEAVNFVRANGTNYGWDTNAIFVLGGSAGGRIAAWLAVRESGDQGGLSTADPKSTTSPASSVTSDANAVYNRSNMVASAVLFGGSETSFRAYTVNSSDLPCIMIHGTYDGNTDQIGSIATSGSTDLYNQLIAKGVPAELHFLNGYGHQFDTSLGAYASVDAIPTAADLTVRFFIKEWERKLAGGTETFAPAVISKEGASTLTAPVVTQSAPGTTYQWKKDGVNLAGRTDATLVLDPLSAINNGNYAVAVGNPDRSWSSNSLSSLSFVNTPISETNYVRAGLSNVASHPNNLTLSVATVAVPTPTAVVTLGNLSTTYDGSSKSATATTTPSGLAVSFTYDGSATPPTGAGSYAVVGTIADPNYPGSASGTLVISPAALPAPDWSGGAASSSQVSSFSYLYTGREYTSYSNSNAPTGAGLYRAVATSADPNYTGSSTNDFVIAGPVAVEDIVTKPTNNARIKIPWSNLLTNDYMVASNGTRAFTLSNAPVSVAKGTGVSASVSGSFVLFTPGVSGGADTFYYTVNEGGGTSTTFVTVNPESSPVSFTLSIVSKGTAVYSGGTTSMNLAFLTAPNQTLRLEYKQNLGDAQWTSAGSFTANSVGQVSVTLTAAGDQANAWNASMYFRGSR
jgi:acetyl esterase/lipase